jgi:hypothetical protein
MKKALLILFLGLSIQIHAQLNTGGIYGGYGFGIINDDLSFRMNPIVESGAFYNMMLMGNLSMQLNLGLDFQTVDPSNNNGFIPGETRYSYFDYGVFLKYWPINDIKAIASGRYWHCMVNAKNAIAPINAYIIGGFNKNYSLIKQPASYDGRINSWSIGVGITGLILTSNDYEGIAPFFEVIYSKSDDFENYLPDVKLKGLHFKIGVGYSFSPQWNNPWG